MTPRATAANEPRRLRKKSYRSPGLLDMSAGAQPQLWVGLFARSRISFPVLKNGKRFCRTSTNAPVRGLRAVRAGQVLTAKVPKPLSSTRSPWAIAAVISSMMALTTLSTSRWYRNGNALG